MIGTSRATLAWSAAFFVAAACAPNGRPAALAGGESPAAAGAPLRDLPYNKSWIAMDASAGGRPLVSGDRWEVPVDYYLDPSEHFTATTLYLWGTGPFIDTPDGKYAKRRGHIGYPGLSARLTLAKPGRGRHVFTFTVPEGLDLVKKNNSLLLLAGFRDAQGNDWPWTMRANNSFVRKQGYFEIETETPGHLFTYDEPVRIAIRLKNVQDAGQRKTLRYTVYDTTGATAVEGRKEFTVERDGQREIIELDLRTRGVFLIELDAPGWEKRHTTLARIPDLKTITGGRPTQFGMTTHWEAPPEEGWAIAQRLGLSTCRRFTRWCDLQPGPDVYRLDALSAELDTAKKYGIDVWLCVVEPPPFAFPGKVVPTSYRAFDCDWDAWREFVKTATTRLKGKFYGWEWLNEIAPGGCEDPVGAYLNLCKIGVETAKAVDPGVSSILAGGLYPRSFRVQMLRAGVGQYVDALPVHYQNGDGVLEARQDLEAAGCPTVSVWEDESARGLNAWAVPPLEELQNTVQCDWVLRQWTDELAAGCERIIYFGGAGSAAGSHDYLLDDLSPRPVAATLAVLTSKMFGAKPLGVFLLGEGGLLHLFERNGMPLLVASTYEKSGETVRLRVGGERVRLTDYQGNEKLLSAPGGIASLRLDPLPCFLEGGDLDVLKAYVVPQIQVARVGAGTSANVAASRRITPRVGMLRGVEGKLAVRIRNLYDHGLAGSVHVELPKDWPQREPMAFAIERGQQTVRELAIAVPESAEARDYQVNVLFEFDGQGLPAIEKPVVLSVISPDMLGNLLANGGFETRDTRREGPAGWRGSSGAKWSGAEGLDDGLGKHVLKFEGSDNWQYASQTVPLRGGQTYLYTAWVRNRDMGCGSNMTQHLRGGREIRLYDTQVFSCGDNNPHWQLFTCRKEMPADMDSASFTPVAHGAGWAMYDNLRVTLFEGSDYVAEAHRTRKPPKIDGRLDEWSKPCPIPLIGGSQISAKAKDYAWTPDNLSAAAYLMWDDGNLYLGVQVRDDVHHATGAGSTDGKEVIEGDSLILGIDPTRRGPLADSSAAAYYISSAPPGGGSGKHTLLRPEQYSGGRQPGHLFRDSSIYDLAVGVHEGGCVYELRIPWTEVNAASGLGAKIGLSIQLNDNDGASRGAQMNWGGGLAPTWAPRDFGIVTLVE